MPEEWMLDPELKDRSVAKESSGLELSPKQVSPLSYRMGLPGSVDNLNVDNCPNISTGKLLWLSNRRNLLPEFEKCLEPTTLNLQGAQRLLTMLEKKTPESKERVSNLDQNPFVETTQLNGFSGNNTGNLSGITRSPEKLTKSRLAFEYSLIVRSERSAQILRSRLLLSVQSMSIGVQLGLVKVNKPGLRPVWKLILKIREPSFGVDMEIRRMLSLTNLEAVSTFLTYYDGWTVTQSLWSSKAAQLSLQPVTSGSRATLTRDVGTQTLTPPPSKRSCEELE